MVGKCVVMKLLKNNLVNFLFVLYMEFVFGIFMFEYFEKATIISIIIQLVMSIVAIYGIFVFPTVAAIKEAKKEDQRDYEVNRQYSDKMIKNALLISVMRLLTLRLHYDKVL